MPNVKIRKLATSQSENTNPTNENPKKQPSEAQIAANRANAQKSTGLKTEEGKTASRENAIKHGLATRRTVLPCEDKALYAQLHAEFMADYQPVRQLEALLVARLTAAHWSLTKAQIIECSLFDLEIDHAKKRGNHPNPDDRSEDFKALAPAFNREPDKHMRSFFRYYSQAERAYYQVTKQLREVQNRRLHRAELLAAYRPKAKHAEEPKPVAPIESLPVKTARAGQSSAQVAEGRTLTRRTRKPSM